MEFTILFAVVVLHELLFLIIMVTVLSILKTKKVPSVIATLGVVAVIGFTFYFVLHPPYKDISTSGQYEVGSTDYFVTEDETDSYLKKGRYREIPIRKYYPMNYLDENLPVIVVSDGVKESNLDNSYLCKEIASQGYVVLSVGAPGHDSKAVLSDGTKVRTNGEFKDELSLIDKHEDLKNSYVIYHKWMSKRMKDLNFVLDDYSSKNPETKFVVMGYYIGGSAAYGLARTREDVVAAIGLDAPFLYDITAYENNEFVFDSTDYTIPVMNIYSDSSFGRVMGKEEYTNNYLFWNILW